MTNIVDLSAHRRAAAQTSFTLQEMFRLAGDDIASRADKIPLGELVAPSGTPRFFWLSVFISGRVELWGRYPDESERVLAEDGAGAHSLPSALSLGCAALAKIAAAHAHYRPDAPFDLETRLAPMAGLVEVRWHTEGETRALGHWQVSANAPGQSLH